jgi:hypothetical protein
MKIHLVVFLTLCLSACQTTDAQFPVSSPYFQIPIGSRLVLQQAIEIPPSFATVRLQFGKIVSRFHAQDFEPLCVFESRLVGKTAQRIAPDSFEIIRVRHDNNSLSAQAAPQSGFIKVHTSDGGGSSRQYYKTELFLRSVKQPQILDMTCQIAWELGSGGLDPRPLTVAEIRQALGDYFSLQLAGIDN